MDIEGSDALIGEDVVQFSRAQNKFYRLIEKELNGRYWNTMYLTRKKADSNDVDQECKENKN